MSTSRRAVRDEVLRPARLSAYPPGEYVDQESFMSAGEILDLADRAGIAPGVGVLDLCCGVAGPGRFVTRRLGCTYLGVDASAAAVAIARRRADGLGCRFETMQIPPLPPGPFEVVLMLETMLAFPDKEALLRDVFGALRPGGRFAFTLEEGEPLTAAERRRMPAADTVWLSPLPEMLASVERTGLHVAWSGECSQTHLAVAEALTAAFEAHGQEIAAHLGGRALDTMLAAHRLWSEWLRDGRVRKFAFVVEKPPT